MTLNRYEKEEFNVMFKEPACNVTDKKKFQYLIS